MTITKDTPVVASDGARDRLNREGEHPMTTRDPWAALREELATPAPLTTLRQLGLTKDTPPWWRNPAPTDGPHHHILEPSFLRNGDIRQIAALTLEGYDIHIHPRPKHIRVVIYEGTTK